MPSSAHAAWAGRASDARRAVTELVTAEQQAKRREPDPTGHEW
jgi:metal-dependent amidase/aminoacylase/carboxypeptidase family protein